MRELCGPELASAVSSSLSEHTARRTWKLTVNRYSRQPDESVPTFPFHVDLPANGLATFLLPLYGDATFEIKPVPPQATAQQQGDKVDAAYINGTTHNLPAGASESIAGLLRVEMAPGALFVLSDEARWRWMHRVVPHGDRLAIVLGAQ